MKIKIFKTNCHIDIKSVEDDINEFLTKISEKDVVNIYTQAVPYGFDGYVVYKDNKSTDYKANIKVV